MFAGNIGEAQNLEAVVDTAEILANKKVNINWIFLGDGKKIKFN